MSYSEITELCGPDGKPTFIGGMGDHPRFADTTHQPAQTSGADDSTTIPPNSLAGLSSELMQHIGSFVGAKEVATLSMTCRTLHAGVSGDKLRTVLSERSPLFVTYFLDKVLATGEVFDSETYARIEAEYGWLLNILPREASDLSDLIQKMTAPMPIGAFNDFKKTGDDAPDPILFLAWLKRREIFYGHAGSHRELQEQLKTVFETLNNISENEKNELSVNKRIYTKLKQTLQGQGKKIDEWGNATVKPHIFMTDEKSRTKRFLLNLWLLSGICG